MNAPLSWSALQFVRWPNPATGGLDKAVADKLQAAAESGANCFADWPAYNRDIAYESFARAVELKILPPDFDRSAIVGVAKITQHHMELRASWPKD